MGQPDYIQSNIPSNSYNTSINNIIKHPKKIDYWFYEKSERLLREQINLLRDELNDAKRTIEFLSKRDNDVKVIIPESKVNDFTPVGNKVNPIKSLAMMEDIERKKYWSKEIERREKILKDQGNAFEPSSSEGQSQENQGTQTN